MKVHELKILTPYFEAIEDGRKTFEIRKNDRNYKVGDFLMLQEYKDGKYTGYKTLKEVTYICDYEQKDNYVVMALRDVPRAFGTYLQLTEKEQKVFHLIVSHMHIYGFKERDFTNTVWEVISTLLGNDDLSDSEQQWFMEYWEENSQS